jgi:pyridoxine 5-phosphate synthase
MVRLSVNVNKIATLRNSRGGSIPSVLRAVETCLDAGAPGITVHPRADQRHIRPGDVADIAACLGARRRQGRAAEFNIEGDPGDAFLEMVLRTVPDQCTLVPVRAGEITSQAGWPPDDRSAFLGGVVRQLQSAGVRVSIFVDPEPAAVRFAAEQRADRVELYTEPFATAFARGGDLGRQSFARYVAAAELAHSLGMGVNAGHDLDLDNLELFRTLPHLDEVSIGHALISRALWEGLGKVVREYLDVLAGRTTGTPRTTGASGPT